MFTSTLSSLATSSVDATISVVFWSTVAPAFIAYRVGSYVVKGPIPPSSSIAPAAVESTSSTTIDDPTLFFTRRQGPSAIPETSCHATSSSLLIHAFQSSADDDDDDEALFSDSSVEEDSFDSHSDDSSSIRSSSSSSPSSFIDYDPSLPTLSNCTSERTTVVVAGSDAGKDEEQVIVEQACDASLPRTLSYTPAPLSSFASFADIAYTSSSPTSFSSSFSSSTSSCQASEEELNIDAVPKSLDARYISTLRSSRRATSGGRMLESRLSRTILQSQASRVHRAIAGEEERRGRRM